MEGLGEITKALNDLSKKIDRMLPGRLSRWQICGCIVILLSLGGAIFTGCVLYTDHKLEQSHARRDERERIEREAMFAVFTNLVSKLREDPKHFERTEKQFEAVLNYYREKLNENRDSTPE